MNIFQEYLDAGLSVVPIRSNGSKAPVVPWKRYEGKRATTRTAKQWERFEGVAIVCGRVSGNLEVLDIDAPTLVRPYLEAVQVQDAGLYQRLCLIKTPRRNESGQGGCHVIYRCQTEVGGNTKLAMSTAAEGDLCLIETRGEGGYVLTVGCSPKCHPTGNLYEHVHGPKLTALALLTAAERDTLHRLAMTFGRSPADTHAESQPSIPGRDGGMPGSDYNQRTSWADILAPHGWLDVGQSGELTQWRRPGKSTGISATTGLTSKAGNDLLCVFSTNALPFNGITQDGRPGVSYTKFGAYALLNHRGDFAVAARALQESGYGTARQPGQQKTEEQRERRPRESTLEQATGEYLAQLYSGKAGLFELGLPDVDYALGGGVARGEVVIIAGRPSHGKSAVALQCVHCATSEGSPSLILSEEMSLMALGKRTIQYAAEVPEEHWTARKEVLADQLAYHFEKRAKANLVESVGTARAAVAAIRQHVERHHVELVAVDYVQLLKGDGKDRYHEVTNASILLRQVATECNVVLLLLCQLNRAVEHRKPFIPSMADLRDSGQLEQDADVVLFVVWPHRIDSKNNPHEYQVFIAKNRNRAINQAVVNCHFNPTRQRLEHPPTTIESHIPESEQRAWWD